MQEPGAMAAKLDFSGSEPSRRSAIIYLFFFSPDKKEFRRFKPDTTLCYTPFIQIIQVRYERKRRRFKVRVTFRSKLAICCARLTCTLIKRRKKGSGAALPGYIARLVEPRILPIASKLFHEQGGRIIVTMGTNGKTTTNSILCCALKAEGKKVFINRTGANMMNGVTSVFVSAFDRHFYLKGDFACIEVDENASTALLPLLQPDLVILTNLFRDQLDRFGEVDITFQKIKNALSSVPRAKLVLNCDDALLCALVPQCSNPAFVYGISQPVFDAASRSNIRESCFCPFCGEKLEYDFFHYGQLGLWRCMGCGFKRPEPDYTASQICLQNMTWSFHLDGRYIRSRAQAPYNIYNTLAAYSALRTLGVSTAHFKDAAEAFDYRNNRENCFQIGCSQVHLHLAKNPVGFQQKLALLLRDPAPKDLLIQINDTWQDGRDISWLWDVDFHYLATVSAMPDTFSNIAASGSEKTAALSSADAFPSPIASVTVCGSRRHDMALRLKYEDICCRPASDMGKAIKRLTAEGTGNLYILVNYSGLHKTNALLCELGDLQKKYL